MSIMELVKNKLENEEPITAVHYVRLKESSKERRNEIIAGNGTKICQSYLDTFPNIVLVEKPYVDCNSSTRNLEDRKGLVQMAIRLERGDVKLVLVDDIHEIASSYADALSAQEMLFNRLGIIVLDMKEGTVYGSVEKLKVNLFFDLMLKGCYSHDIENLCIKPGSQSDWGGFLKQSAGKDACIQGWMESLSRSDASIPT